MQYKAIKYKNKGMADVRLDCYVRLKKTSKTGNTLLTLSPFINWGKLYSHLK